jgi:hypothetical protein
MMYRDSKGVQRRANGFHLMRQRGTSEFYLLLLVNSLSVPLYFTARNVVCDLRWHGWWKISLPSGSGASTPPSLDTLYSVSYREVSADLQAQITQAIEHIKRHGTPFENDESVYA